MFLHVDVLNTSINVYVDTTKKSQKISAWNEQNEILEFLSLDILHADIVLTDRNTKKRKDLQTDNQQALNRSIQCYWPIDLSSVIISCILLLMMFSNFQISTPQYGHSNLIY